MSIIHSPEILTAFSLFDQKKKEGSYIELFYDTPFTPSVSFLLSWNKTELSIVKRTAEKSNENFCTVTVEKGTINSPKVHEFIKEVSALNVPAVKVNPTEVMGRDGYSATLVVGSNHHQSSFSWMIIALPDGWEPLDQIVSKILGFDHEMDYSAQGIKKLKMETDTEVESPKKNLFLEYEEFITP
ncbi:MAG: hypothetical protein MI810_13380 [Flavobacteriales bacterium]|nr:hypothetical protein [Flavobacteriales bacterium]